MIDILLTLVSADIPDLSAQRGDPVHLLRTPAGRGGCGGGAREEEHLPPGLLPLRGVRRSATRVLLPPRGKAALRLLQGQYRG